jgi:uncharacterized protein (DUF433 family)
MTLRLPREVAQGVERLAHRFGHRPAQLGARLVEEGLRRRDYPQIDLRETAAGRVAYVAGTRFAVYWVAQLTRDGMTAEEFAKQYELPLERIRAALAYAAAFRAEIEGDIAHAEANRKWLESQQAPCPAPRSGRRPATRRKGRQKAGR